MNAADLLLSPAASSAGKVIDLLISVSLICGVTVLAGAVILLVSGIIYISADEAQKRIRARFFGYQHAREVYHGYE